MSNFVTTEYFRIVDLITSYLGVCVGFKIMCQRSECELDKLNSASSLLFMTIFMALPVNSFVIIDSATRHEQSILLPVYFDPRYAVSIAQSYRW
jgi:hypothetical protein